MGKLSQQEINEILCKPIISIICTLRSDGTPHMTPVWHLVDGDQVIVGVEETSVKARNVRANPKVALCVATDETPQRWLQVNGTATLTNENVPEVVRNLSRHYMGTEEGETYAEQVLKDLDFVLIRIAPTDILGFDGKD